MERGPGSGGFKVTPEMERILRQPGFISSEGAGKGQRLRELYQQNCIDFDVDLLNPFARACFLGVKSEVIRLVESGQAPDLSGTETPYKFSYLMFVAAGSERITKGPASCDHVATMRYLLASGAPPDTEDLVGHTALHHVAMNNCNANHARQLALARLLLEKGANPNHRNRYGEVPVHGPIQNNQVGAVELLIEFGADLSIPDADGFAPLEYAPRCGPQITALVQRWLRKRSGEEAPLQEKKCEKCGKTNGSLKMCAKCHAARYCSTDCQRAHWPTHKPVCHAFSTSNTVTVRPSYDTPGHLMPTADFTRQMMGIRTDPLPAHHHNSARAPRLHGDQAKAMVIKVQVPWDGGLSRAPLQGDLLVYNKKRDFVCTVHRRENVAAYDRIASVVHSKGTGGAKAYFPAELKTRDELVIKVGEVLAEQPF